ncbi:hypothetical protein AB0C18_22425 [Nonomuraea muscovyensis]|uniref:hypothetical protein n=1 Tax=Nonomuraea muscovyensis TaxID=1124761 RepID=UPI0033CF0D90
MSMQLPASLTPVCLFLGPPFPDGDEDVLDQMGGAYDQHGARMREHLAAAKSEVDRVVVTSEGDGVTAMHEHFTRPDGPHGNLGDASTGSQVVGLALKTSGGIVLAHKGVTILQYGLTAAALAQSLAAGGLGAALAPAIRQAALRGLDQATLIATSSVMS